MGKLQEINEELKSVLSGRTVDALLPPIVFVVINAIFSLHVAVIAALGLALFLAVWRLLKRQSWTYALGGLLGVGLAAGLAFLRQDAASYFLPAIISSAVMAIVALVSLVLGKPIAAWLSHLTRGWPMDWFWRADVKPAYREVSWMWLILILMRLAVQTYLFQQGDATTLAWANVLLGWPVTIIALVLSYLYGIWRLHKLGGPGVHEFKDGAAPPWEGQTRGF